jgi:hypothetical protein
MEISEIIGVWMLHSQALVGWRENVFLFRRENAYYFVLRFIKCYADELAWAIFVKQLLDFARGFLQWKVFMYAFTRPRVNLQPWKPRQKMSIHLETGTFSNSLLYELYLILQYIGPCNLMVGWLYSRTPVYSGAFLTAHDVSIWTHITQTSESINNVSSWQRIMWHIQTQT